MVERNEASIDFFYQSYLEIFKEDCQRFEISISEKEKELKAIMDKIKTQCRYVPIYDDVKVEDFLKISISSYIKNYEFLYSKVDEKRFIQYLKELREVKVRLKRIKEKYAELKKYKVDKKLFKNTIETAQKIMVDRMIYENQPLYLGSKLGVFKVHGKRNKAGTRVLNQGATEKIKERLLAEGKTLKSEENPNGSPYKVYYTDSIFYRIKWFRESKALYADKIKNYRFKVTKGNNNIMSKLYQYIRSTDKPLLYET